MVGRSWKTSLMGYLAAILIAAAPTIQARLDDRTAPPVTVASLAPALAIAMLGRLAKDNDKTGVPPGTF